MRTLVMVIGIIFSLAACAEEKIESEAPRFQAGVHYAVLEQPFKTTDPSKIEVAEVFWYGCSHCFRFESIVRPWKAKLPDDVYFELTPAMWPIKRHGVPENWMEIHARAFFSAKQLNVLPKVHQPLFKALNAEKRLLKDADEVAELFAAEGVEKEAFLEAYSSFIVTSQVLWADARAKGYGIEGTPELVVDGRYRISARMAGGQKEMLEVVDFLIDKRRAERS